MEENKFKRILDDYLEGKATPEEVAWLESAYINWNADDAVEQSEFSIQDQTEKIWKGVSPGTKTSTFRFLPILYAAASIAIISTIGFFAYRDDVHSSSSPNKTDQAMILPGKQKAILVLANGKQIDLDQTPGGHLADQNGIEISKTAEGQLVYHIPAQEVSPNKMEYNTVRTPAGGQYQVNLPDGSKVWLNASSSVTFATSFIRERGVKLEGEAYFEVSKLSIGDKRVPFVVESKNQEIEVLGTHFNVNAYPDEVYTRTTLLEGSVKINNSVLLKPGQQAIGNDGKIKVLNVDAQNDIDWKNGDFILEHNDFRSIMRKISRWYDVEVIYRGDAPKELNLGGWISRSKDISSVLRVMEGTGRVHFKIEGRRVTVTR